MMEARLGGVRARSIGLARPVNRVRTRLANDSERPTERERENPGRFCPELNQKGARALRRSERIYLLRRISERILNISLARRRSREKWFPIVVEIFFFHFHVLQYGKKILFMQLNFFCLGAGRKPGCKNRKILRKCVRRFPHSVTCSQLSQTSFNAGRCSHERVRSVVTEILFVVVDLSSS